MMMMMPPLRRRRLTAISYGVIDNRSENLQHCLRRALSPTFPAGEMVFFIPWRVVAEEPGAAHFGFGGAMLLDLLGPMVRPPAAPSISILVIFRFGATMELGRSERTTMRPLWSYRVDGANSPDRKPR
jgi:hypothetical protein